MIISSNKVKRKLIKFCYGDVVIAVSLGVVEAVSIITTGSAAVAVVVEFSPPEQGLAKLESGDTTPVRAWRFIESAEFELLPQANSQEAVVLSVQKGILRE